MNTHEYLYTGHGVSSMPQLDYLFRATMEYIGRPLDDITAMQVLSMVLVNP